MIGMEFNEAVVLEQQDVLEKALSTNPKTQKALQELIRKAILQARAEVVESIKFKNGDPRQSAKAVRTTVYKKILGANINIYNSRKSHGTNDYTTPRKGVSGRGGNRRPRVFRDMNKYAPNDRGFILRCMNSGVGDRYIQFTVNDKRKEDKWNKHPNTGYRGAVGARNFFKNAAESALIKGVDALANMIDDELEQILNNG